MRDPSDLARRVDAAAARAAGVTVSVWLGTTDGRQTYARAPAEPHYAASTAKLPLLVAAHRLHERGELDLDDDVRVHDDFRSVLDGSPYRLRQEDDQDDRTWAALGGTTTLRDLATRATVNSGNLAASLLLERVGTAAVAEVLRDAGCSPTTTLPRGIGDRRAAAAGLENRVTAADLAAVLAGVTGAVLAGGAACRRIEGVLAGQQHRAQVPAGLPAGTYVAHKTGWVAGVAHDVAIVRPEQHPAYLLAVCLSGPAEESTLFGVCAEVSAATWSWWTR